MHITCASNLAKLNVQSMALYDIMWLPLTSLTNNLLCIVGYLPIYTVAIILTVDDMAMANEPLRIWAMHLYTTIGQSLYVMKKDGARKRWM